MDYENYTKPQDRIINKILIPLEKIWPFVYKILNSFFFATIDFLKWIISGLFRF